MLLAGGEAAAEPDRSFLGLGKRLKSLPTPKHFLPG